MKDPEEPNMADQENFIARWSRRKHALAAVGTQAPTPGSPPPCGEGLGVGVADQVAGVATPLPSPPPQGGREQTEVAAWAEPIPPERTSASPADLAELPPIESITGESDIRAFLAPGVPADLARAALRRAWAADPNIRDFVGLAENAWDFNAPDAMPGFGPLEMSDELRQGIMQLVGRNMTPPPVDSPGATTLVTEGESPPVEPDPKTVTGPFLEEKTVIEADPSSDPHRKPMAEENATGGAHQIASADEQASAERRPIAQESAQRMPEAPGRRHGGALPR